MKLISMTDFVLEQTNKITNEWSEDDQIRLLDKISNYANFLKQPLKLEMFVTCVDNEVFNYSMHGNKEHFEQAKQKVLFEGFQYCEKSNTVRNQVFIFSKQMIKELTIEDLVEYDLTLTESAIKKLGL